MLDLRNLAQRLKSLFSTLEESEDGPVVLLVHDLALIKGVLHCAGVDISSCRVGLHELLRPSSVSVSSDSTP